VRSNSAGRISEKEEHSSEEEEVDKRSMCSVSSDELDGDINLSDDEDAAQVFRAEAKKGNKPHRKFRQEIDTNIFRVEMRTLKDGETKISTGDPNNCKNCDAILNRYSLVQSQGEGKD
jgi:hypothetical protein